MSKNLANSGLFFGTGELLFPRVYLPLTKNKGTFTMVNIRYLCKFVLKGRKNYEQ